MTRALVQGHLGHHVVADRVYDSDDFCGFGAAGGIFAMIPARHNRKEPNPHDVNICNLRNSIERIIGH